MAISTETVISVIIPTKGRIESLRKLLESLQHVQGRGSIAHEIIVADNAPEDATANCVERLVDEYAKASHVSYRHIREPVPGKCSALNRAIPLAKGSVLAFLDDDVTVTPNWLKATSDFFTRHTFEVMQGAILFPPGTDKDVEFLRAWNRYKTIVYVNLGDKVREVRTLTGANIAARREVFQQAGLFDERLGPGRGGYSDDWEFAQRVLKKGMRIGYEARSVVYHEVDWERFTESFFRLRHEQQGRSRLIYKRNSLFSIIPNLMRSVFTFGWYSSVGNERRTYRAKGRYYHYRAMLQEKIKK